MNLAKKNFFDVFFVFEYVKERFSDTTCSRYVHKIQLKFKACFLDTGKIKKKTILVEIWPKNVYYPIFFNSFDIFFGNTWFCVEWNLFKSKKRLKGTQRQSSSPILAVASKISTYLFLLLVLVKLFKYAFI